MKNNVSKYRKFIGLTQTELAEHFDITLQSYSRKERGVIPFNDREKVEIKNLLLEHFPDITIDEIFFADEVSKVEMGVKENVRNQNISN
ncbi:helix-turn-helix transcriptional regulator [Salinicoccus bachuensis]|uniref:Helix-turn-helix transcriptional regulator n=1 Tax=Salinicoccus bachuensis TaxID=3136731 RepID=A0ABZ3CID3_9STAP